MNTIDICKDYVKRPPNQPRIHWSVWVPCADCANCPETTGTCAKGINMSGIQKKYYDATKSAQPSSPPMDNNEWRELVLRD